MKVAIAQPIYFYISKSWSVTFIVATLQLSYISVHIIIIFLSNFPIIFFLTFTLFLKKYIFSLSPTSFYPYLFIFPLSTTLYINILFISPLPFTLPFHLPTTLYINIILHLPFFFFFFCPFLFTTSYYKFVILSSIFYNLFPHKKKRFPLSPPPSLSLNFLVDFFIFLASLL